jgi:hypothetical protein
MRQLLGRFIGSDFVDGVMRNLASVNVNEESVLTSDSEVFSARLISGLPGRSICASLPP